MDQIKTRRKSIERTHQTKTEIKKSLYKKKQQIKKEIENFITNQIAPIIYQSLDLPGRKITFLHSKFKLIFLVLQIV